MKMLSLFVLHIVKVCNKKDTNLAVHVPKELKVVITHVTIVKQASL